MALYYSWTNGHVELCVTRHGVVVLDSVCGSALSFYDLDVLREMRDALTESINARACDGNHAAPRCNDPNCWQGEDSASGGAPMNTGGK